jgi:mevalonate kinase
MNSKQEQKNQNPELTKLTKELEVLTKEKEKSEELNKKVQLVYDQVQGWCNRVIQKIDQQFNENIQAFQDKSTAFLFEKIARAVCKQLE